MRPDLDDLPSKTAIFEHWKIRLSEVGLFIDWGEPGCWVCRFRYGTRYDIRRSSAPWSEILRGWERIPLQRCHIVPRSLGGSNEPDNLFLMCRERHDAAPDTNIPDIFFTWARKQSSSMRENAKIDAALKAFDVGEDRYEALVAVMGSEAFRRWNEGRFGLHRPQSNYAPTSCRLKPATMIGLAVHFLDLQEAAATATIAIDTENVYTPSVSSESPLMTKSSVFTMKLESDLRDEFMAEAEAAHRPASQIVRDLMRDFVRRQRDARDHNLFVRRKVEVSRESMRADRGRPNDEVESDFARRRAELLRKADEADA